MPKTSEQLRQWRNASESELASEIDDVRKELFNLRFRNATRQLDNSAEIQRVRRNIARLKTLLRERQLEAGE